MRNLTFLIAAIILISLGSCENGISLFKGKKTKEQIAVLQAENKSLKSELENIEEQHNSEITEIRSDYEQKLAELQKKIEAGTMQEYNAYYVIIGSFKNLNYAEEYATKVKEMGLEGNIIAGPNDFNLVTYGTYNTLKSAIGPMKEARDGISIEAWIFFKN